MHKPTSITVLGILNLVLAGMGILGGCYAVISPLILPHTNPALAEVYTGAFLLVTVVLGLLGLGSKGLMAASGYGLVKGEPWGRKLGRLWAVFSIVLGLVMVVVNAAYIMPMTTDAMVQDMNQQFQQQPGPAAAPPIDPDMMKTLMVVVAIVSGLIAALPYQITFLVLMNRPAVNRYFAWREGGGQGGDPDGGAPMSPASSPAPASNPWQED